MSGPYQAGMQWDAPRLKLTYDEAAIANAAWQAGRESVGQGAESLESQVKRLANFIMREMPGEPSRSEGAIDTAIRLLRAAQPRAPVQQGLAEEAQRIAAVVAQNTVAGYTPSDPISGAVRDLCALAARLRAVGPVAQPPAPLPEIARGCPNYKNHAPDEWCYQCPGMDDEPPAPVQPLVEHLADHRAATRIAAVALGVPVQRADRNVSEPGHGPECPLSDYHLDDGKPPCQCDQRAEPVADGLLDLLLLAYDSGHREGWEPGPNTNETMSAILDALCNAGLDPNGSEGLERLARLRAARGRG